jgi:prepilin-type N-terminal cleavage/methylation domain-containing protein
MRRGVTLIELLVVLTLVGILASLAAPALTAASDRGAVRMALAQLSGAHNEARLAAVSGDGVAILSVDAASLSLRVVQHGDTSLRWRRAGPAALGLTFDGPGRTFTFAPSGLPLGASNATLTVIRNGVTGRLVVSRLGRLRVEMD